MSSSAVESALAFVGRSVGSGGRRSLDSPQFGVHIAEERDHDRAGCFDARNDVLRSGSELQWKRAEIVWRLVQLAGSLRASLQPFRLAFDCVENAGPAGVNG